jgi:SMC interacting uncharacterized protein involved in chromosome segregation
MPSDVTRGEFQQLTGRVDVVEREVEGEKLVTRYILEQTRRNGDDLARLQTEMKGMRADMTSMRTDLSKLDHKIDGVESRLEAKIDGLAKSLPQIVGDEMRRVLRERGL